MTFNTGAGANSRPLDKIVSWRKACRCDSTASTAQYRWTDEIFDNAIRRTVTFYPQPSCDRCGKPWVPANAEVSGAGTASAGLPG